MNTIFHDLALLAGQNHFLTYLIIYFLAIVAGNLTAFACLWLVFTGSLGSYGPLILVLTLLAADISADLLWYSLGQTLRDTRLGNFIKRHLPRHQKIENYLQKNSRRLVFFSKFFYAAGFPILFLVGWFKIRFRDFFRTALLATAVWLVVVSVLAYSLFSGLSYFGTFNTFRHLERLFLVGFILFLLTEYALSRLARGLSGLNNGGSARGGGADDPPPDSSIVDPR